MGRRADSAAFFEAFCGFDTFLDFFDGGLAGAETVYEVGGWGGGGGGRGCGCGWSGVVITMAAVVGRGWADDDCGLREGG